MKSPLSISAVGNLKGRYGIAVAAQKHVQLLAGLCDDLQPCEGHHAQHAVVYHHAAPPLNPPPWYGGKRVVAYWVIESSVAAPEFKGTADACAQIWTASEASARAIRALGTETPVFVIPHPVQVPDAIPDRSGRDTITTLVAFAPGWERKNPEGAIRAWQRAFPKAKGARLIIKMRHAGPAAIDCVKLLAGDDERVEIITEDISREALDALYVRADIFLSLHHAGAFEMHVAEAAAFGLPIVCSAVGGVLDYLGSDAEKESYALLVSGEPIVSRMEDALNRHGEWLQPDEEEAAQALRKLAASVNLRAVFGRAGRESVTKLLSPERVTSLMAEALAQLPEKAKAATARRPVELLSRNLRPLRSGLELVGDEPRGVGCHIPVVMSHRRSGTHLLGEIIARHWQSSWLKTHHFPDLLPQGNPAVYVLRNPIDCLYSTWQWWHRAAANDEVARVVRGMSFADWLDGKAGPALGFRGHKTRPTDNLEVGRGCMYDPVKYWLHHWQEADAGGIPVVIYESLIGPGLPMSLTETLTKVLGREPLTPLQVITEGVGLSPSKDHEPGKALAQWPTEALTRLRAMLKTDMLRSIGFKKLNDWLGV